MEKGITTQNINDCSRVFISWIARQNFTYDFFLFFIV